MMKHPVMKAVVALAAFGVSACASSGTAYQAAPTPKGAGYYDQQIENNRYQVSYRASDPETAKTFALRRAAELTLQQDKDWFRVVSSQNDIPMTTSRSGGVKPSVSVGGSFGSGGYSGAGVGIGIGFPFGSSKSAETTWSMEIMTGSGRKPQDVTVYDAADVLANLGPASAPF